MSLDQGTLGQLAIFVLTVLFGIIGYLLKVIWREKKARIRAQASEITKISAALSSFKDDLVKSICGLESKLAEVEKHHIKQYAKLESKVDVLATSVQHHQGSVSELKGRVDDQLNLVSSHIHTLGHMSRQMEKIFEFIDAPKRATDTAAQARR